MTKIKNEGTKIVHIGTKTLLPGEEIIVSDKVADTPAIKVLVQHKNLSVSAATETVTAETKAEETVAETAETTENAAEETEAKKATRKSKKTATETVTE